MQTRPGRRLRRSFDDPVDGPGYGHCKIDPEQYSQNCSANGSYPGEPYSVVSYGDIVFRGLFCLVYFEFEELLYCCFSLLGNVGSVAAKNSECFFFFPFGGKADNFIPDRKVLRKGRFERLVLFADFCGFDRIFEFVIASCIALIRILHTCDGSRLYPFQSEFANENIFDESPHFLKLCPDIPHVPQWFCI